MSGLNPLAFQGNLNRVLTHVVIPSFPQLTVIASSMAKAMLTTSFDGNFTDQIGTATGVVNSPEPYVMGQVVVSLLRSQPLAALWLAQLKIYSVIGSVSVYSDATTFPEIDLVNCSVMGFDPNAFDGQDPAVKVTIRGTYFVNNALWIGAVG